MRAGYVFNACAADGLISADRAVAPKVPTERGREREKNIIISAHFEWQVSGLHAASPGLRDFPSYMVINYGGNFEQKFGLQRVTLQH